MKKIDLYQQRGLGEKLEATTSFVSQNWRALLRMGIYLLLPVTIITAAGGYTYLNSIVSSLLNTNSDQYYSTSNIFVFLAGSGVGMTLLMAMIYGLMRLYEDGTDINELSFSQFWPILRRNLPRSLGVCLALVALSAMVFVLLVISLNAGFFLFLILVAGLLLLCSTFSLLPPTALLRRDDAENNLLDDTLRYGFKTWGGTLLLFIVVGFIANFITSFFFMPAMLLSGLKDTIFPDFAFQMSISTVAYQLLTFLLNIAGQFCAFLVAAFFLIALGFQYGNAAERVDSASMSEDIKDFDSL